MVTQGRLSLQTLSASFLEIYSGGGGVWRMEFADNMRIYVRFIFFKARNCVIFQN
jgi:hypothetical protein